VKNECFADNSSQRILEKKLSSIRRYKRQRQLLSTLSHRETTTIPMHEYSASVGECAKQKILSFYLYEGKRKGHEARLQEIFFFFSCIYDLLEHHEDEYTTVMQLRSFQHASNRSTLSAQNVYRGGFDYTLHPRQRVCPLSILLELYRGEDDKP
jgi:hypothetical protein